MPAPANDNFASAIALSTTLPANLAGTTIEATQESGEDNSPPYFGGTFTSQSVWYTFTPASTGRYRFTCTPDAAAITGSIHKRIAIDLSTASAVNAITVLKFDRFDGSGSEETFWQCTVEADLTASTTYHIRVSSQNFSGDVADQRSMDFDLDWAVVGPDSPPSNDNLGSAHDLGTDPADGLKHAGTTFGATVESGLEDSDWPATWYKFETGGAGAGAQEIHVAAPDMTHYRPYWELYRVTTDPPTTWAHMTFVDSGDINDPFPHAPEDNWDALASPTLLNSTKYRIVVSNWDFNGTTGDYELHFGPYVPTPPPTPPDNDDVASFSTYEFGMGLGKWDDSLTDMEATHRAGTTIEATAQAGEPSNAGFAATRSVWYKVYFTLEGEYKFWVESAVDCVLGLYDNDGSGGDWHGVTFGPGTQIDADDDSGPGDQPELTFVYDTLMGGHFYLVVDSKTEGDFTLHMERIDVPGTPPANDRFEDAELISSLPGAVAGTTVAATAESREDDAQWLGIGPVATVWYKFVATRDGQVKIECKDVTTDNEGYVYVDVYKGNVATADLLTRIPPDMASDSQGVFSPFNDYTEAREAPWIVNVVNGETYYIRVQTEEHSEDFTLHVDYEAVYIDIQPSGLDVGPYADSFEVYVNITASGAEEFHGTSLDAGTVYVDIQPAGVDLHGDETVDSATVYMDIRNTGGECYSTHMGNAMDLEPDPRWTMTCDTRWSMDADPRWTVEDINGEGVHC